MKHSQHAFTMIELIFVIVILGILSAIAIPKMSSSKELAEITKGRSDIASIRSAIITERQSRLIKGDGNWITALSGYGSGLFTGTDSNHTLLMYGLTSSTASGHWSGTDPNYDFTIGTTACRLVYTPSNGKFLLTSTDTICLELDK
jgi:general secretion pathway protein G